MKSLELQQKGLESLPADQEQGRVLPWLVRPAGRGKPLQELQNAHALDLPFSLLVLVVLFD